MPQKFTHRFSEQEMQRFAAELAMRVKNFPEGGQVLFLTGEVGAGKTTFTRFFSEALGATSGTSPTFALLEKRELPENIVLFHGDLYREYENAQRGETSRITEILDEYQEMQEQNPEKTYIWVLEWFPEHIIPDFFSDVPKILLNFEHAEKTQNRDTRKISLQFDNNFSVSKLQAEKFLDEYKTPLHIRKHIEMVRKISVKVAQKLHENKIPVDRELIENSAILHDAVKYVDFEIFPDFPHMADSEISRYDEPLTPEKILFWKKMRQKFLTTDHGKAMAQILTTAPYHFLATAKVINSHMTRHIFSDETMSWEEKCVHYADKRALHDTFVSIQERLQDGKKRYAHESSPHLEEKIFQLVAELEQAGNFSSESLIV